MKLSSPKMTSALLIIGGLAVSTAALPGRSMASSGLDDLAAALRGDADLQTALAGIVVRIDTATGLLALAAAAAALLLIWEARRQNHL